MMGEISQSLIKLLAVPNLAKAAKSMVHTDGPNAMPSNDP